MIPSWVRIDAFLAEKYHYSPSQIAELTPTECFWLCLNWDVDEEKLKMEQGMDALTLQILQYKQGRKVSGAIAWSQLTPEQQLDLAAKGILSQQEYIDTWQRDN